MKFTVRFHDHTAQSVSRIVTEFGVPGTVIEIGCFEGDTTFHMASMMVQRRPKYTHYAIDPYTDSADLSVTVINDAYQLFTQNLNEFEAEHPGVIKFMHMDSWTAMTELYNQGVRADFIYVDGDHRAPGVMEDMVFGFRLLNPGGIMLCDDAQSWRATGSITNSPRIAIDTFLHCYWDLIQIIELPKSYQVAFRKNP